MLSVLKNHNNVADEPFYDAIGFNLLGKYKPSRKCVKQGGGASEEEY